MKHLISGAVALALLGAGTPLRAETLVDTGFETATDAAFNGTAQPAYAQGFRDTGGRTGQYDNGEFATALFSVDGAPDSVVELARLDGVSGGDVPLSTGWQRAELELSTLAAGTHTIAVGGFNYRKTVNNELSRLRLDDVRVIAR